MYKIRSHEIPKCTESSFQTLMEKTKRSNIPSEFSLKEVVAATSIHTPAKVTNILRKNMTLRWRKKKEQQRIFTNEDRQLIRLLSSRISGWPKDKPEGVGEAWVSRASTKT